MRHIRQMRVEIRLEEVSILMHFELVDSLGALSMGITYHRVIITDQLSWVNLLERFTR